MSRDPGLDTSVSPTLAQILERPDIWRGKVLANAPVPGVPTGFADLDRELPGGGWPRGNLIELLPKHCGIGELSLLLPVLVWLSSVELAWLVCVAPPQPLYAPALNQCGIDLSRLLMISGPGRDAAWACERALAVDGVGGVVAWLPTLQDSSLRRLQLAAEASHTLLFVFRPAACASQSSPAPLRLILEGDGEQLMVRLLKRRGGAQTTPLSIAVHRPVPLTHALACSVSAAPASRGFVQSAIA